VLLMCLDPMFGYTFYTLECTVDATVTVALSRHLVSTTSRFQSIFAVATSRGVTRLDGARGKKRAWRPHVRT